MKVVIRKAKPEDWETIQRLNNEVFEVSRPYDKRLNMKWPYSKEGIKYYKKVTKSKKYCCIMAEIDHKPIGYLVGLEKNYSYRLNKTAEIDNMGVTPKYRTSGVGSKLVTEFKKWCKKKGLRHIKVSTYYYYKKVINFYRKQKMVPIDITLEGSLE